MLLKKLGFPWNMIYAFIFIPKGIRDSLYSWFARNRYKWFGKNDYCMIPSEKIRGRFLDWAEK
jgi:predicted DCC family thiol-disulfide oxidoreductase YuxK